MHGLARAVIASILAVTLTTVGLVMFQSADAAHGDTVPDGDITALVNAIIHANDEDGTVTLASGGNYNLLVSNNVGSSGPNGLPLITGAVTIDGNGATIRRGDSDSGKFRVFEVRDGGTLDLNDVTVSDGDGPGLGGGIYNAGTLTLADSNVSDNTASGNGGGIYNLGSLTLINSELNGNESESDSGGGIYNTGSVTLSGCTISGNSSFGPGGGIYSQETNSSVTVTTCEFTDNQSKSPGGGIYIIRRYNDADQH